MGAAFIAHIFGNCLVAYLAHFQMFVHKLKKQVRTNKDFSIFTA